MSGPSLGGVSILLVTPLDRSARVAAKDLDSLLDFVGGASHGGAKAAGATVCGEMGEGFCLTPEDRALLIRRAKEKLGRGRHVIAGVFALSQRDAELQAEQAAKAGADAVMAAPVAPFPYSDGALTRFFAAVGKACGLPVIGYLNKMFKSPLPTAETLDAVYAVPEIAALKDSSGDAAFMDLMIARRPKRKLMIQTVSGLALAGVRAGADGLMVGTSNLIPESVLEIWAGGAGAEAAQERLKACAKLYAIAGGPKGYAKDWVIVKEALAALGVISEDGRHPAPPYQLLSDADRAAVRAGLSALIPGKVNS